MRRWLSVLVLFGCAVFAFAAWWSLGQPVAVPDAPSARADCVSYAPFRGGESPLGGTFMASAERVAEDMALLSQLTDCVRTYGTANGLDLVPAAAQATGLQVMQGIWIGRNDADNAREMARGIALAQEFPQTIRAVVVGNEALLRREITPQRLAALLDQVKAQVQQPVTYADVWEFWHQNPSLAAHVDFVTLHLLPYWEDQPAAINSAIAHVTAVYQQMEAVFSHKPLLIGEIGWPSSGRQRQGAEASTVNEVRFIRGVVAAAAEHGWRYNLIESFDQPWKRALEGTTGGYWGLFHEDRTAKVTLQGPVVELPSWKNWAGAAALGGVVLAGLALLGGRRPDAVGVLLALGAGAAAGNGLAFLTRYVVLSARTPWETCVGGVLLLLMALIALAVAAALRQPPESEHGAQAAPWAQDRALAWLRRLALAAAAVAVVGHLFDARYRDFPSSMFVIAAVGFALLRWQQRGDQLPRCKEDSLLATLLIGGAAYVAVEEGWHNDDALIWAVTVALLGLSAFPWQRLIKRDQRHQLLGGGLP
jgi:exo-beta-1,3-glucanase (GH17 family)